MCLQYLLCLLLHFRLLLFHRMQMYLPQDPCHRSLSAYCGAVSAACGSGAAITYLYGGSYEDISATIVNTIGNVGGIVCDGAKSSCAAKIASAVDAAILGHFLGRKHHWFQPGEGIVQKDVEGTIKSMGYIGRVGMKDTDKQILNIMIDQVKVD